MGFNREIAEARIALQMITSEEMPRLAWDALEAGLDGPAIRRLAALDPPNWSEVEQVKADAMAEMGVTTITKGEAACRLAKRRAGEVLESGEDVLSCTRYFYYLWFQSGYAREIASLGSLDDYAHVKRCMGESDTEIRRWVLEELKKWGKG